VFANSLFGGRMLFQRDVDLYWYGTVEAIAWCAGHGAWPLWNPFDSFGQPLLGLGPWQVLYPTTWLTPLLPPPLWYPLFAAGHLAFTGFGAYRLARRLDCSWAASATAGALWAASGPFLSLATMTNLFAACAWLPWMALAAERAVSRRSVVDALLWGAAVAATVLAGSPELTLVGAGLGALVALSAVSWRRAAGRENLSLLATCLLAGISAFGLSAAQWVPTLDVHSRSARAHLERATQTLWSNHPLVLLQSVLPVALDALPLRPEIRADFYDGREPFLYSLYLGMASVVLVVLALAGGRRRGRGPLIAVGLVATLLSTGRWTPAYAAARRVLPVLEAIRYPSKFTAVAALCWALLAGLGLDSLHRGSARRAGRLAAAAAALVLSAAALLLAGPESAAWRALLVAPETLGHAYAQSPSFAQACRGLRWAGLLTLATALLALALPPLRRRAPAVTDRLALALGLLVVAEVLLSTTHVNPTVSRALYGYRSPALEDVPSVPPNRVVVLDYSQPRLAQLHLGGAGPVALPFDAPPEYEFWLGRVYPQTLGSGAWRVEGTGSQAANLRGRDVDALARALQDAPDSPAYRKLLELAGVRFVLALHEEGLDGALQLVRRVPGPGRPIRVFRVPDPVPEAYAVGAASIASNEQAFRRVLLDGSFDPRREVLLAPGPALEAGEPLTAESAFDGRVEVVDREPDSLELRARLSRRGFVVVTQAWDPWWKATIDGRPAPVLRANVAFRAVSVPAGDHLVTVWYRPLPVYAGVATSLAALLAALVAVARFGRLRIGRVTERDAAAVDEPAP
jgi:hypothetical protein